MKISKNKKNQSIPFGHRLILNQWLLQQCGFDPLAMYEMAYTAREQKLHPLQGIASILRDCREGMDSDNRHYFYKKLDAEWQEDANVTRDDLLRYDHNIVSHTVDINRKRSRHIVWKYHQWLSLLFVEIYLDRYFNQRDKLQASLNEYIRQFNTFWEEEGIQADIDPYAIDDLNKVCLQNATGSGKTLLMHVNFLQFRHYAEASHSKDDLTRTILITPNDNLSAQHAREMEVSGIRAERLSIDRNNLFSSVKNGLRQVDYTEITKLSISNGDGPSQIAVRSMGDQNLLLVDEAHRGMGSKEETGWFRSREKLVGKGFAFEYSATFKEAITAANHPRVDAAYAKNILFDYSYRYFYEDGYGKDYRIFNLPKHYDYEQQRFIYLTACLLAFYQQIKLFEDKEFAFRAYNLEKPLWVFVGKSVRKATGTRDERITISDIALILKFISLILQDSDASTMAIERILKGNAQDTGLLDDSGNDIFAGSFLYIKDLLRQENWTHRDLLRDIFSKVFLNSGGGQLTLARIKGNESEIMLRVGQEETPFGLINVGDADGLIKHIEKEKKAHPGIFTNLNTLEAEFSETFFGQVHESYSPVTILLGSKKFIEGWDCWRVSTLGLMHVGRSEGAQIIQLFGRGVRLKGHGWSLKRSGYLTTSERRPEYIQYLETLNIFGVQADFMERFKKFLEDEDLPRNDQIYTVPLNVTYDFGKKLQVLRPRKNNRNGAEYDFKKDAKAPAFGDIPKNIEEKMIVIDWYPRIQSLESKSNDRSVSKNETVFSKDHLAFLDYADLFLRLEKFKKERTWHNLNISKRSVRDLLEKPTWYKLLIPTQSMNTSNATNIFLWQEIANELIQKYCEELYNYAKAAFIRPRLELRPLTPEDNNIPSEQEYRLTVDSTEQALIDGIVALQNDIKRAEPGILQYGNLKACLFDTHLYQPVMHSAKNSKIKIAPVSLNESEFKFIEDLYDYLGKHLQTETNEEFYLLRNESRGKGIGFFEAGNFYPDFLLWKIKGDSQSIAFIEPHGLMHEGPGHKKIEFHKTIKSIQDRLDLENVCLNSFIVTPTRWAKLNWGLGIDDLADMNVLFMHDSQDTYISNIISRMDR